MCIFGGNGGFLLQKTVYSFMKFAFLSLILLLFTNISFAQSSPNRISIAYFGEHGIHPGLKIGAAWTFHDATITKTRRLKILAEKRPPKNIKRELFYSTNLAYYQFPNNHIGMMLTASIGMRRIKTYKGRFIGAEFGLGGLQRIYNIDVVGLDENGNMIEFSRWGITQFTPMIAASFGRDMSGKWSIPVSWYFKPTAWLGIPYVHSVAPSVALELGISLSL